jgi:hypothetical protein
MLGRGGSGQKSRKYEIAGRYEGNLVMEKDIMAKNGQDI